ncbi:hypothetical protein FNYG_14985 [Fusarium nygamai]|uniref:HAT C-terminal dimerisation domain-containing protein n=1 Tax=Gibberella nygamai TaxID=42673 RepID=A0A2K0UNA5_GIBNY|nr:hypothetical protein FNYG_14985 [Fusarium nygamai]
MGMELRGRDSIQNIPTMDLYAMCAPEDPTPQSYESKGTQNAELHLWKAHGYWDPSGRRSTPSEKKGGKRVLASISDFMNLKRSDPKEQALANSLIKRFDRGEFQKLIVNWIVESQQSFKQVEHPQLQQIFEYLNPAVKVTSRRVRSDTEYRDLQITVTSPEGPVVKRRKTTLSSFDRYRNRYRQSQPSAAQADEYIRWQASVSGSDKDVADPVEYWVLKRFEYPRLSRMALDVMTVPAMSSECERLFSATGLMVTPLRNRLDAGTIGLIQTLRSWLRAGIIEDVDSILLDDTALQEAVGRDGLEERQE